MRRVTDQRTAVRDVLPAMIQPHLENMPPLLDESITLQQRISMGGQLANLVGTHLEDSRSILAERNDIDTNQCWRKRSDHQKSIRVIRQAQLYRDAIGILGFDDHAFLFIPVCVWIFSELLANRREFPVRSNDKLGLKFVIALFPDDRQNHPIPFAADLPNSMPAARYDPSPFCFFDESGFYSLVGKR